MLAFIRLEELGLIGNCQYSALIDRWGSVVWCGLPRFDAEPVFGSLLDRANGGHFTVGSADPVVGDQRYLENSNVLETTFTTTSGRFRVRNRRTRRHQGGAMDSRRTPMGIAPAPNSKTVGPTDSPRTPVAIAGFDQLDPALTEYIRQRLGFKLGKFADRITALRVRFSAPTPPRSSPIVACRITARLNLGTPVSVQANGIDARAAFDNVVDAHERAVRRRLDRRLRRRSR
jgi:ribosome-associated translation inhibitor RaiA